MTPSRTYQGREQEEGHIDILVRLTASMLHRFTRDPDTRQTSALHLLRNAVRLYAEQTSAGAAALAAGEIVGELAIEERRRETEARRA